MNYEIALKLKDTGIYSAINLMGDIQCRELVFPNDENNLEEGIYVPTLSELISVCKPFNLFDLKYLNVMVQGMVGWLAFYEGEKGIQMCHGSTPDEAVANLWLALNP